MKDEKLKGKGSTRLGYNGFLGGRVCVFNIICYSKREIGVLVLILGGFGVDLLWTFMGVCVGRVRIFESKSGITPWILDCWLL
jgi:hypothetical protein